MQSIRDEIALFFASRDGARARAYAATFGGRGSFGSYTAAADPRVGALYLCTLHHRHREHVALAAQAGKHILSFWRGCPYPRSTNSTMLPSGSLTMAMVVPGLMVVLGRVKAMCSASNRWITSSRLVTTKVR